MSVEIITKSDLMIFKAELLGELETLIQTNQTKTRKWLRTKEVLNLLNISPGTLQNYRIKGLIKYSKIGNTLYYSLEDIEKILINKKSA